MLVTPLTASMSFSEACESFLLSRATINARRRIQYVKPRTTRGYEELLGMAGQFFGPMNLEDIKPENLRGYQEARANGDVFVRRVGKYSDQRRVPTMAGAAKINRELGMVKRVMTEAGAWTPQHEARYLRLDEPDNDVPKALSMEEQDRFLAIAESNPEWQVLFWYSLIAQHTTFSSDEMRTIRQGDVNLPQQILAVNRSHGKNKYRRRQVPVTDGRVMWALEQLLDRSIRLVGCDPRMHLFPLRMVRGAYDGNQPMSRTGLRKQFEAVRDAAGLPWFCLNGWRHTAITNMAAAGVPIAVIMEMAGHTTAKMSQHYTHISQQVMRQHQERMQRKPPAVVRSIAGSVSAPATTSLHRFC